VEFYVEHLSFSIKEIYSAGPPDPLGLIDIDKIDNVDP
jgi:hypothetical protein